MSVEPTPSNADSTIQFCALGSYTYGHAYICIISGITNIHKLTGATQIKMVMHHAN